MYSFVSCRCGERLAALSHRYDDVSDGENRGVLLNLNRKFEWKLVSQSGRRIYFRGKRVAVGCWCSFEFRNPHLEENKSCSFFILTALMTRFWKRFNCYPLKIHAVTYRANFFRIINENASDSFICSFCLKWNSKSFLSFKCSHWNVSKIFPIDF